MRQRKRRIELFSFFDLAGMEAHLERMAARGWMLDRFGPLCWHYRRTEPQRCTFTVCCFPKGSEYDPEPPEDQRNFYDLCAHTGWELTAASAWLQVFRNTRPDPVPIETDPALELETLHRATRRNRVIYLILLVLWLLQLASRLADIWADPLEPLSDPFALFSPLLYFFAVLLFAAEPAGYYLWRRRAKRAVRQNRPLPAAHWHTLLVRVLLGCLLGVFVLYILLLAAQGGSLRVFLAAVGALYILVLIALVNGLRRLLQRHGAPKTLNAVLTTLASFLLAFALMGGITYGASQAVSHGLLNTEPAVSAAVPLELEELTGKPTEEILIRHSASATPLLARQDVTCYGRGQYTDLLDYRVLTVHLPALYGLCRDRLMEEMTTGPVFSGQTWRAEDAAPWGAQAAWQLYNQDGLETHCYLICYDGRIIRLSASWPLTEAQMAVVEQALGEA